MTTAVPASSHMPLLQVENLVKVFKRKGSPDVVAVNDVSFDLWPREYLGIVGESGSGKSTIANMITQLVVLTAGHIIFDGCDITHVKGSRVRDIYRGIQMVFQMPIASFDPRRTLGDGVAERLINNGASRKEAHERAVGLLECCGLAASFAHRYPHEVSGGQCQRAAIARALAAEPRILICDEATSALDMTVQARLIDLLKDLRDQYDLACLFICHDLALVQSFCDRVIVMHNGIIEEEGTPADVIGDPQSSYTKRLVDAVL